MRNGSRLQHYLAVKNEIFSSADRAFYKNAKIYTPVRFALMLFFRIDLFYVNRGTVCAFKINQFKKLKRSKFKIRYASSIDRERDNLWNYGSYNRGSFTLYPLITKYIYEYKP
jgi:hypothetical protein